MREAFGDKRDLDKWRAFHVEIAKLHVENECLRALNVELVAGLELLLQYRIWAAPVDINKARAALAKAKEQT